MKKNNLYDAGNSEDDFKHDPEAEDNAKKYRLPFALCKAHGIATQDWWTPRDAWKALENGGVVDDVSEEYKEYYKNLKKERNKQYQQSAKQKSQQLNSPEHNPDKNYIHKYGYIAGAKKGKPMDFKSADSGNVNPYYGKGFMGYSSNCQTCVAVYVARRQGYDVRALPNLNNINIARLSNQTNLAYVDEYGGHPNYRKLSKINDLDSNVKPNSVYSLQYYRRGSRSGHIVIVERDKTGQLFIYDPQTNIKHVNASKYLKQNNAYDIKIMDLTNVKINEKFCDKIMKRR